MFGYFFRIPESLPAGNGRWDLEQTWCALRFEIFDIRAGTEEIDVLDALLRSSSSETDEGNCRRRSRSRVRKPAKKRSGRRRGRPRWDERYPNLTHYVEMCVMDRNHAEAHRGRAQTIAYTPKTVKEITEFVHSNIRAECISRGEPVPGPKNLPGKKTIRRQGDPKNPNNRAACYYTGKVSFRGAPRCNDKTRFHPDFHYSASDVKTLLELAALYDDEVVFLSCDNKNKIRLGAAANSNPTKPRGMFMRNQQPSLPDHSFPAKDAKIVPMGYMVVNNTRRARSQFRLRSRRAKLLVFFPHILSGLHFSL